MCSRECYAFFYSFYVLYDFVSNSNGQDSQEFEILTEVPVNAGARLLYKGLQLTAQMQSE
jgi:hypothetical protein